MYKKSNKICVSRDLELSVYMNIYFFTARTVYLKLKNQKIFFFNIY